MKGHKASRSRKMDMGVDEPRMDRDDRPTRSNNNNPAVENAAEARKSGGRAKMKRVGMVEGMKAMGHAGRKPRRLGGRAEGGGTDAPAPKRQSYFEGRESRYIQNKPIGYSSGLRGRPDEDPEPKRQVIRKNAGSASNYITNDPIGHSSGLFGAPRRDRAAALVGYGGSEDSSPAGSPPPPPMRAEQPARSASLGEGAMTGKGQARPTPAPRPRPAVAVRSGPTPGELEADRMTAKYNTSAERGASPGEEALLRDMRAQADPEERERTKSYNTTSDLGLKRGGTARKARASGGRTGSNNAPLSSAHMGDRSPTASKEIG